jgi:chromosome segregation ATPase
MNPASLIRWRTAGVAAAFLLLAVSSPAEGNAPTSDEVAALKSALAQTQDKLEMSLHSYTLVERENDKLKEQAAKNTADADHLKEVEAALKAAVSEISTLRATLRDRETDLARLREVLRQTQDTNASLGAENSRLKAQSGTVRR